VKHSHPKRSFTYWVVGQPAARRGGGVKFGSRKKPKQGQSRTPAGGEFDWGGTTVKQ